MHQVIEKGKAGEVYNVSAGNEMSNIQVVESILELLGKPRNLIKFVEDRPGHDARYSLDSWKIRSVVGWRPKHEFSEALKTTIDWYMHNESCWRRKASKKMFSPNPWKPEW